MREQPHGMADSAGRRMSLREISRLKFVPGADESPGFATPASRRPSSVTSRPSSARKSRVSVVGAAAPRAVKAPSALQTERDKLAERVGDLEQEIDDMRATTSRREEELRRVLREAKAEVERQRKMRHDAFMKLDEAKAVRENDARLLNEARTERDGALERAEAAEQRLRDARGAATAAADAAAAREEKAKAHAFDRQREKEAAVAESRERELASLRDLDAARASLQEGVRREMALKRDLDASIAEREASSAAQATAERACAAAESRAASLAMDLEGAEANLREVNAALRRISGQVAHIADARDAPGDGGGLPPGGEPYAEIHSNWGLLGQVADLKLRVMREGEAQRRELEIEESLARQRFSHAEDLAEMVVERACHREVARQHQQRILGVLRAMRSGISVAQTKLDDYIQAKN